MKSYPTYEALAIDLDLHCFDKISVLRQIGNQRLHGDWFVTTDDGQCYLFDKDGNLDDINKITTLFSNYIRKSIKKIIIPNSVTRISGWAFSYCDDLSNIIISDTMTYIGECAFLRCNSLENLTIPNTITSIGKNSFGTDSFSACELYHILKDVIFSLPRPGLPAMP